MIDWLSRDEQVIYFGQKLALLIETVFVTAEVVSKVQEISSRMFVTFSRFRLFAMERTGAQKK